MQITPKDHQLLLCLQENSRMPMAEIARRLGVSRPTAQARLDRLEQLGVIAGYGVRLSDAYESGMVRAHVMAVLKPRALGGAVQALAAIPGVQAVHSVSGGFDLVIEVSARSIGELDGLIDRVGSIEGVEKTESSVILSTRFVR